MDTTIQHIVSNNLEKLISKHTETFEHIKTDIARQSNEIAKISGITNEIQHNLATAYRPGTFNDIENTLTTTTKHIMSTIAKQNDEIANISLISSEIKNSMALATGISTAINTETLENKLATAIKHIMTKDNENSITTAFAKYACEIVNKIEKTSGDLYNHISSVELCLTTTHRLASDMWDDIEGKIMNLQALLFPDQNSNTSDDIDLSDPNLRDPTL